jgi:hypothetical protein
MAYDLPNLILNDLIGPLMRAEDLLARLDERVRKSQVGAGFVERGNYHDAVAAMWVEGELVHVEDLVLHDAMMDVRAPTHELTRAHAVLRARRRIFSQPPEWALSRVGLDMLVTRESAGQCGAREVLPDQSLLPPGGIPAEDEPADELALQLAEMDAVLARSQRLLDGQAGAFAESREGRSRDEAASSAADVTWPRPAARPDRNPLIMDSDWDEQERLAEWLELSGPAGDDMPPLLAAALAWDGWERIAPLQHQAWLGHLLVGALLRRDGKVVSHLVGLNIGLRAVPRERRRARDRATRLLAFLEAAAAVATAGLKELDRLAMARTQMERRLKNRRSNSSLPALIELVLARPMVSTGLVASELGITQRAALDLLAELGLREMTGRGRFRAWGVI